MGPTCVLSAPGGPHVGPINLAKWDVACSALSRFLIYCCVLLIGAWETNFSETGIKIHIYFCSWNCIWECHLQNRTKTVNPAPVWPFPLHISTSETTTGPTHAKLVSLTSPCCSRWPCPMNTLKEEYTAHDWRAATSVQRAPVTWREWGLWKRLSWSECRLQVLPAHM